MQERSFKRILKQSVNSPLTTLDRFVSFLESRLDVVLFRSCFASSLHKSRQMISHGHILVNGKRVRNPSTNLSKLDIVEVDKTMEYGASVSNNIKINFSSRFVPAHLEIDYKTLSVIFLWDPNFEGTYYPIKANYEIIQRFYK
jgi:small subunit ribosomal protein S4